MSAARASSSPLVRMAKVRRVLINLALLTVGSAICAVAVNGILVPQGFLSGGLIGIALIAHYLWPVLGVGWVYAVLNLPLVVLGWISISGRFVLYTAYGIAVFSLATDFLHIAPFHVENHLLAAILAGIISGVGSGLVFRSAGSLGGLDILAVWANRKWNLRLGWSYLAANVLILGGGAALFSLEKALYAMIYTYVLGRVVDAVVTGFNQRQMILIISDQAQAIADKIMDDLHRGVTFLSGHGAYTGHEKQVIMSIVTLTELARMKDLILDIDPQAFIIINQTLEVLGKRHGTRRVY